MDTDKELMQLRIENKKLRTEKAIAAQKSIEGSHRRMPDAWTTYFVPKDYALFEELVMSLDSVQLEVKKTKGGLAYALFLDGGIPGERRKNGALEPFNFWTEIGDQKREEDVVCVVQKIKEDCESHIIGYLNREVGHMCVVSAPDDQIPSIIQRNLPDSCRSCANVEDM